MKRPHATGFTLIEMMIVVAIIGILAAIAYPSYQQHVRSGNRADAKATLMETAQFMERFFSENNRYDRDLLGALPVLPFAQSPREGTARYLIQFNAAPTATAFQLDAVPQGGQAADPCGTLSINQAGVKMVGGSTVADCWNR